MRLLAFLLAPWHACCRWHDRKLLWPECLRAAHGNREHAMGAFMFHAIRDEAWEALDEAAFHREIARLP